MTPYQQVADALRKLLISGDEVDRCYAARALGIFGDKAAVEPLINCLRDEDIDVCVDASEALGRIGDISATPSLIDSLENDSSGEVCTIVAASLGKLGSEQAIEALTKVILERPERLELDDDWDTWWDVQLEAVKALGKFGYESNAQPLLDIIDDQGHQDIESELLAALANIPGKGVDSLISRLQDSEARPQNRWRAARALGKVQNSVEAVKALGRALQSDIPEVRAEAAGALAEQGAQRYLRAIILLLRDEHEGVRKQAIHAITKLADKAGEENELPEDLLSLVTDPSNEVRTALFKVLATLTEAGKQPLSDELFDAIVTNLDSEDFNTAAAACTLLGNYGDNRALSQLLALLGDSTKYVMTRRHAALALGDIGDDSAEVVEALAQAVGDKEQTVRLAALSALKSLHREEEQADAELETRTERAEADESDEPLTPLGIILAAIQGKIEINTDAPAAPETAAEDEANSVTSESEELTATEDDAAEAGSSSLVEIAAENNEQKPSLVLPEHQGQVVQVGEVNAAQSTLNAIAMDNVDGVLGLHEPEVTEGQSPDVETEHYMEVVEKNKAFMRRMRAHRKITPQQDVRLLGVRVLIGLDNDAAAQALINALNDEDAELRREAAIAIAETVGQGAKQPVLMDALGSLVAQLALGEPDQRRACACALGALGNQAAAAPLLNALNDKDVNVRIQVMDALANLLTRGADPIVEDHMVTDPVAPKQAAEAIARQLADREISIRVAAARALVKIIQLDEVESLAKEMTDKIIDSVFEQDGQEARTLGKILRQVERPLITDKLLAKLDEAEDSVIRSVAIEMLEELFSPEQEQPNLAA